MRWSHPQKSHQRCVRECFPHKTAANHAEGTVLSQQRKLFLIPNLSLYIATKPILIYHFLVRITWKQTTSKGKLEDPSYAASDLCPSHAFARHLAWSEGPNVEMKTISHKKIEKQWEYCGNIWNIHHILDYILKYHNFPCKSHCILWIVLEKAKIQPH